MESLSLNSVKLFITIDYKPISGFDNNFIFILYFADKILITKPEIGL